MHVRWALRGTSWRARALLGAALLAAAACSSCILVDLGKVPATQRVRSQYAYIAGTVDYAAPAADPSHPEEAVWLVVYVVTVPCDADWEALKDLADRDALPSDPDRWAEDHGELAAALRSKVRLADHVALQRSGFWYVRVAPGCYGVGAFADLDRNFRYADEPAASAVAKADRLVQLGPGERHDGIELVIDADARMPESLRADVQQIRSSRFRSPGEQLPVSLSAVTEDGAIADLADPRFGPERARLGYYDVYRFLWEVRPGIYFLEPYDPDRIPVLFVHGALGFPRSFERLVAGLDSTRFQAWVALYPSGSRLTDAAEFLSRSVASLQLQHGFERMAVVAHSMGGLVARAFVLRHHEKVVEDPVELLVSIATPWGGDPAAAKGVARSPVVVPSWRDMDPGSEFLAGLFFEDAEPGGVRRRLPESVAFYLLFGVEDRTVSLPSQVRWEAVRDARERWPLVYDHTAILESEETSQLLNEILDRELR